ncbi:MAG: nucleotidyltransferase domain-containing protein [Prevotella sp.]|nr:nucleotidyltransferase domain-containing protein [Prevotella sp.]
MNKFGLETMEMDKIIMSIASIDGVDKAVIYGSRAKGNYKPFSDVDISLVGKSLSYSDLLRLHSIIDDLLLPYDIDLNIFDLIQNENLKEHILRCGRVIYESRNKGIVQAPLSTRTSSSVSILSRKTCM